MESPLSTTFTRSSYAEGLNAAVPRTRLRPCGLGGAAEPHFCRPDTAARDSSPYMTPASRCVLVACAFLSALATSACGFEPHSGDTGDVDTDYRLRYYVSRPGHVEVTYEAKRDHELLGLCVFLLRAKRPAILSLQSLGHIRATPDVCAVAVPAALQAGEKRKDVFDFPRTDWFGDERKDTTVGLIVRVKASTRESRERFYYP